MSRSTFGWEAFSRIEDDCGGEVFGVDVIVFLAARSVMSVCLIALMRRFSSSFCSFGVLLLLFLALVSPLPLGGENGLPPLAPAADLRVETVADDDDDVTEVVMIVLDDDDAAADATTDDCEDLCCTSF